jgi:flagellar biosynthesis protein FlhF
MNPKRFWGRDMSEALRAVRQSLGPDALLMDTKNLSKDAGGGIEITAVSERPLHDDSDDAQADVPDSYRAHPVEEIRAELAALKSMLGWLAPGLKTADEISPTLIKHGFAPEIIAALTEAMQKSRGSSARERLEQGLAALLPNVALLRTEGERLALIGPAGVGKTTSIIKLTIYETQRRECKVGWVSTDQRRLATGDVLAVYAGILGVRYETATDRRELKQAFDRLSGCDLVLVDTAGVNPRDPRGMKDLTKLLHGFPDLRRALLMSAATNRAEMADQLGRYRKDRLYALIFTKLDECRYFGAAVSTALSSGVPLSYVASGQNFVGDFEIAEAATFAHLIFPGVDSHG